MAADTMRRPAAAQRVSVAADRSGAAATTHVRHPRRAGGRADRNRTAEISVAIAAARSGRRTLRRRCTHDRLLQTRGGDEEVLHTLPRDVARAVLREGVE